MSKKEQPPSPRRVLKIGSQETASFQVNKDDILQNKVPRSALSKAEIADPESSEVRALSELEKNCYREKYRYAFYWWGDQAKIPEPYPVSFEIKIKQIEIGGKHFMALSGLYFSHQTQQQTTIFLFLFKIINYYYFILQIR